MICTILLIILASLFLFIIIFDKTCHTVPMMLIGNTCLSAFVSGCILFSTSLFTLKNDLKQIHYEDALCIFRGYIQYSSFTVMDYSLALQALYRYVIVIYPTRLFLQSFRFQLLLICITWVYGYANLIAFIFTGDIIYNADSEICQYQLHLSFAILYGAFSLYIIPVSMIMLIYLKLVRYVKETSKRITSVNILARAQRELKMMQRIVIIITILITFGVPYVLLILISFFTPPPRYHFRIAFTFVDVSLVSVLLALFQFTDPLKESIMKKLNGRPNTVATATP
jgi:hypothetical protein